MSWRRSRPLVLADQCELLRERLAAVTRGEAFVLQGGDCAETFEGATADAIRAKLHTLLQWRAGADARGERARRQDRPDGWPIRQARTSAVEDRDGIRLP